MLKISFLILIVMVQGPSGWSQEGVPAKWEAKKVSAYAKKVIDGDTLDIDLNQNKKLTKTERIRLWYVDTPELSDSHKGKDLRFGVSAKGFLEKAITQSTLLLWTNPDQKFDTYHRILGLLTSNQKNLNLEIIRKGHSPFDTRFEWPDDFEVYLQAEALAFNNKKGIWSSPQSRQKYLTRLKAEGRTVYSSQNKWFVVQQRALEHLDPSKYNNHFLKTYGTVQTLKDLSQGAQLIYLKHPQMKTGFPIISFEKQRQRLKLNTLKKNDILYVEGFVSKYKNKDWQLQIFRGYKETP
ncbi:thermonuclease family protein [Deltaproteobacteria bacterium TL4]